MQTLVYHLNKTNLNAAFLDTIRASIDAERIKVVIESETSSFEEKFEEKIHASMNDPISYTFEGDEFERYY